MNFTTTLTTQTTLASATCACLAAVSYQCPYSSISLSVRAAHVAQPMLSLLSFNISCCQPGLRMLRSQCCRCCRSIISCCLPGLRMLRSQCCRCCQCCRSLHPSILFQVVVYIHLTPVSPIYCSPSPTKEEEGKKRILSICWFSPVCVRLFFFILPHTLHNFSTLPTTKYI